MTKQQQKFLHFQRFAFLRDQIQFFQNSGIFFCEVIISKLIEKGSKPYIMYQEWQKHRNQHLMAFFSEGFVSDITFWYNADLTPVLTSSTQKWVRKVYIGVDRKIKMKSKINFEVKYLFMKLFS